MLTSSEVAQPYVGSTSEQSEPMAIPLDFSAAAAPQRVDEWRDIDEAAKAYHLAQWVNQKQSTSCFSDFVGDLCANSDQVVDLGCGAGAATFYLSQRHAGTRFLGLDYSMDLIALASQLARERQATNLAFAVDDWFKLVPRADIDGVVSLQTLSWLPGFEKPLDAIFERLKPRWIALTSLFYEGDISCAIEVNEHVRNRRSFYNVYSIPAIARHVAKQGYRITCRRPFVIDFDIERPVDRDVMATYTVLSRKDSGETEERLQISGPLLMNWHFLLIERNDTPPSRSLRPLV